MLKQAIPILHMTNADATEKFYCELLGFQRDFEVPASETKRDPCYFGLSRDGATIHLSSHAFDAVSGGAVFFMTEDVDRLHAEFLARNVPIYLAPVDQTWGLRELYVLDPDRNSVRFGAPIKP